RIDTGDASPVSSRDYRRSPKERQILHDHVVEMLEKKVIKRSNSPWCSQPIIVEKED
ncbi:hypothetical protein BJV82DRAFT_477063, partial [Fennellomyces sp. T-0311]